MDDDVVATARSSPPADSTNHHRLLLLLSLSLSPASSKVITKGSRRRQLADGGVFRCRTCGRCFSTLQALGGHRTGHKRPRVRADDGLDLLLGARPGKGNNATDVHHRCHACGMVFPTWQALGGHMRRHRAAAFEVAALELEETMPTTTTVSGMLEDGDGENDPSHLSSNLIQFI